MMGNKIAHPTGLLYCGTIMTKKITRTILAVICIGIIGLVALCLLNVSAFYKSANVMKECSGNMSDIFQALNKYAENHDGRLPIFSEWNDILVSNGLSTNIFLCVQTDLSLADSVSDYAINENVVNVKVDEIPKDVVLLFECQKGWNQAGGAEIAKGHILKAAEKEFVNVLFGNGSIRHVQVDDVKGLKWKLQ